MNPIITVVVPVYKNSYLRECIESVLNQSFRNFELLLVEDGSPDNSGAICDEYALKDSRIRVIHKQNEGINATRNRGGQEAKGEWVVFSDDDDTLTPDALESLYALHEGTDLVIGFPFNPSNKENLDLEQCRINSITCEHFPPTPWAKLYRRSLLKPEVFNFPRGIDGCEDMIMNIRVMFSMNRAAHFCFKKVYNFRRNTASVSHTRRCSLAYEETFYKTLQASIPADLLPKYNQEIVKMKLNGLLGVAHTDPQSMINDETHYISTLRQQVKAYHYKMNLRERLLLNTRNAFLLKKIAFAILVKNSLSYRLGLNH